MKYDTKPYVIGVDMGGTNTAFGTVNRYGEILFRDYINTGDYHSGGDYITALSLAINRLLSENDLQDSILGIGMGTPSGNMNDGSISGAANIEWAKSDEKIFLARMLTEKTGLPCRLANDANAAALGEMIYGVARGLKDFIMITLGTGLGGGIVVNGQLVAGHNGLAGELGHVRVVGHNGRRCGCGRTGCLEAYCSATGVSRTAREFLEANPAKNHSLLCDITDREITSKDVFDAAKAGDSLAVDIFRFTGRILGEALSDFVTFSNPEAIILFGGLTLAGDFLLDPLKESFEENVLGMYRGKTSILVSELNNTEAAILGASALAWGCGSPSGGHVENSDGAIFHVACDFLDFVEQVAVK
ncbi:MAG: ROK family protein [Dysgonamonadaceae bacterium]|jgi:glucokinase|nr:ROK family protein [Dysgonamonadaceae bacterium]